MRPTPGETPPSVTKLVIDSLREIGVLVLVFGVLDGVKGTSALVVAASGLLGAAILERYRT